MTSAVAETLSQLVVIHREDSSAVQTTLRRSFSRLQDAADPAIFISTAEPEGLQRQAAVVPGGAMTGIPVAVKDNIDAKGHSTTAACPAFAYDPSEDATAVARLRAAGALVVGKTNLDQFATGLVGVRSPYGIPRNALKSDLVPGGSSSGSAVAVARGIVPIALGTDTAGSGRVPAGLNNIVGLKPSLGLIPTRGVVPACRSLDCISIFALTVADAFTALEVMAGHDPNDPFSRAMRLGPLAGPPSQVRIGIPRRDQQIFFGDDRAAKAFAQSIKIAGELGWSIREVDIGPCLETARLLYEGPWVAERTAAVGRFLASHRDAVHPVTASIIEPGHRRTAVEAFEGQYRLRTLRAAAEHALSGLDALLVPTAPAAYRLDELAAEPIKFNSQLGTYTNFVNLLDMAGLAVPAAIAEDGTPFGVTFLSAAGRDAELAALGNVFHVATGLPLGALGVAHPGLTTTTHDVRPGEIAIAVVGAHLSGMALNHELTSLGARFLRETTTAPDYKLFALAGTSPPRPGLLRVASGSGASIAIETWALSPAEFGQFVAAIPAPLSIGTLRLVDGSTVKGFLVEAEDTRSAQDVTIYGGWRKALPAIIAG